ncbi:MAG: YopX family protein [Chryseolinea sp.]
MRELKFRVWFPGPNVMGMVTNLKGSNDGHTFGGVIAECFVNGRQEFYEAYKNFILMQYTGRKDKNGTEIYEGDIFRVEEDILDLVDSDHIYYLVIVWVQEWCMFATLRVDEYPAYLNKGIEALDEPSFWTYTLEDTADRRFFLCGNIYQNPELLP